MAPEGQRLAIRARDGPLPRDGRHKHAKVFIDCLQELGIQLRDLNAREAELELAMSDQGVLENTDEWIAEIYDEIV
jgi:hypothetical protein